LGTLLRLMRLHFLGKVKAAVASGSRKKVVLARAVPRARRRAARRLAQVSTNARR